MSGIYLPFYDSLYFAEKEKGTIKNGDKILVTSESRLRNVLFSYSIDYTDNSYKAEFETNLLKSLVKNIRNLRATNCVLDYCLTAEGAFGGSINQTTKIWDIAAPYLLLKEAGALVLDINGSEIDFCFNTDNYQRNFTIVATSKQLLTSVVEIINTSRPDAI